MAHDGMQMAHDEMKVYGVVHCPGSLDRYWSISDSKFILTMLNLQHHDSINYAFESKVQVFDTPQVSTVKVESDAALLPS